MKKIAVISLFVMLLCPISLAQVPGQINYQGFLKSSGAPVSGIHVMRFAIYATPTALEPNWLWVETQTVTVDAGLYSVQLGLTNAITPEVFDGMTKYLGVKVGNDQEMDPRIPLISVPYAFRAEQADTAATVGNISPEAFVRLGPSASQTTEAQYGLYVRSDHPSGRGVFGMGLRGVQGNSTAAGGRGVLGYSGTGTNAEGVYGYSESGTGVFGESDAGGTGVRGEGETGVYGLGSSYGIYGTSNSGDGVYGTTNDGYGGYFTTSSSTKAAVYAEGLAGYAGHFHGKVRVEEAPLMLSYQEISGFSTGTVAPSVARGNVFFVNNAVPITIDNFEDGRAGQIITLHFGNNNATIDDGTFIFLNGSINYNPDDQDTLQLVSDGMNWYEIGRSDN